MSDLSKIQMPDNTIYEIKDEYSRYIASCRCLIDGRRCREHVERHDRPESEPEKIAFARVAVRFVSGLRVRQRLARVDNDEEDVSCVVRVGDEEHVAHLPLGGK